MSSLAAVAFRNILRNPRRTFLTLLAVIVGVAATIFLQAFAAGFLTLASGLLVEGRLGALQIHRKGFLAAETDPLRFDMAQDETLVGRIMTVAGVAAVSPRIGFEALVGNGTQGTMAWVTAVNPALAPCRTIEDSPQRKAIKY